ncbi:DUF4440 domain-containing protein [Aliikangiella sp. G2MR2-5]|uniref:YybH family protein n=1 Tax=Aliikangiella sp. G2MR2-5 TaxID=2788943 RepID=UPI0018A8A0AD|nr:DUF4440 domain-containing protein [Aliikangiella sp. G2MR2-5]
MKISKICIIFLLLVFVLPSCFADELQESKLIRQIMLDQERAWNHGDLVGFMKGYWQSDKLQFIGKNGIKKGWKTTLENYQKSYPTKEFMGKLKFTILDVDVENTTAFVLGKWMLKRENDSPQGFFTLYWKKINGQWKIVIDHSS